MSSKIEIMKLSHGFHVKIKNATQRDMLFAFCSRYTDYEEKWCHKQGKMIISPKTVYATSNIDRTIFGFLLTALEKFILFIQAYNFNSGAYELTTATPAEANRKFDWKVLVQPRPHQLPAIEFLLEDTPIRVLPLPTGQGKTLSTMMFLAMLGEPFFLFMKSGNMKAWIDEFASKSNVDKKNIVKVSGASQLAGIVRVARELPTYRQANVFLISTTTFNAYLDYWISGSKSQSAAIFETFAPHEFFAIMGITTAVTDEAHEVLHQVVRRAIMLNAKKNVYLSATLDSSSANKNYIYGLIYPTVDRFTKFKENDHVSVRPYYYFLKEPKKAKYKGHMGYNQAIYENYLLSKDSLRENYFQVIYSIFKTDYLKNRKPGTKMLILMGKVEMCELFTEWVTKMVNDETISIASYTASTDDSVLDTTEIIVSTPGSCGTGTDIPNLIICINTVAVNSKEQIVQIQGRTRPVKLYPEIIPRFYYLACKDIDRHLVYDKGHQYNFQNRSKDITPSQVNIYV